MIILTTFDLDEHVYAALRAGASGFLLKDVAPGRPGRRRSGWWPRGDALLAPTATRRLLDRFLVTDATAGRATGSLDAASPSASARC